MWRSCGTSDWKWCDVDIRSLIETLEKLLAHIAQHFADEEMLLAQHNYKDLESHRRAHAALLARAGQIKASAAAGKATLGDLVEFLANTVVAQHLFKEDRKFFPLFKFPQAGFSWGHSEETAPGQLR